jgi:methionyl-tRNA formyltransferase
MNTLRVVFMGTPEFAAYILDDLIANNVNVVGVVTAPDRPAGRGQLTKSSEVKEVALKKNIPLVQPADLKEVSFLETLTRWNADVFAVVAFRMLPKAVWSIPSGGTFNLHASLLPDFRGAAPIHRAIMAGCKETGLTTFFIDEKMDTGAIIEQVRMEIGPDENVGHLHDRMKVLGAMLIRSTLEKIAEGKVNPIEQEPLIKGMERLAPKLFKENCRIDWEQSVQEVHNFVRGLSPFPAAWTILEFKDKDVRISFKLLAGKKTNLPIEEPGKIKKMDYSMLVPCSDFYFEVTELQPEGKRRMLSKEFLAGNALDACFLSDKKP